MPLVTTVEDQAWQVWDDPTRGHLRWCLLTDGADPSPGAITTGVLDLATDGWLGRHRHTAPEQYHVLEGQVAVVVDGDEVMAEPGAVVRIPPDVEHGVRAVDGPVRVLFLFPTTPFDDVVYRFSADDSA